MNGVITKSLPTSVAIAALSLFAGCGENAPPSSKTASTPAVNSVSTKPPASTPADPAAALSREDPVATTQQNDLADVPPPTNKVQGNDGRPDNSSAGDATASTSQDDPQRTAAPERTEKSDTPPPAERIMLLSSAGPLLVDLHVTIDGKPHRQCFDDLIDHVLKLGDTNADGLVTWHELTTHPRFRHGQFGNPPTTTYQSQQDITRLYDTIKNDRVDRQEVARYLTSNQGGSRALALDTSNSHRELNRGESPVRKWLDIDSDFVLSPEELAQADVRLRQRDMDDDEILLPADFTVSATAQDMMITRRRPRFFGPDAGWHLHPQTSWNEILYAWEELYRSSANLAAEDLMLGSEFFESLDIDEDGVLRAYELAMLLEVDPHIALEIELHSEDDATPRIALTSLRVDLDQVHGVNQHQPNRITITMPGLVLDLFALDLVGRADFSSRADAIVRQGDADDNQYLSEEEFAAVAGQLNMTWEAVDLDEDEKVFAEEVATVLEQRQFVQRGQIRVWADDQPDALIGCLDVDHDGRLDSREITQCGRTLKSLDNNGDGSLQLHEIPASMVIGVARGAGRGDRTFEIPVVVREPSESAPRWFQGMDRNRDRGISRREFLGTRGQFGTLDVDEDGFIDALEAAQP